MRVSPVRVWVLAPYTCGRSSVVEHFLAKEKVTSSNLVARSRQQADRKVCFLISYEVASCWWLVKKAGFSPLYFTTFWRRGQVAKAELCKSSITGSNPVVASTESLHLCVGFFVLNCRLNNSTNDYRFSRRRCTSVTQYSSIKQSLLNYRHADIRVPWIICLGTY